MAVVPMRSQILIVSEEEYNSNRAQGTGTFNVMVPTQDVAYDQYLPLGDAVLLLTGLAGAYLLGKQRNKKEE
jgi:hypothetical protein